jgi:hypothetical protein
MGNGSTISKVSPPPPECNLPKCKLYILIAHHMRCIRSNGLLIIYLSCLPKTLALTGKTAIKCLLAPAYAKTKKVPKVTNEEEASALMVRLLPQ